jgi:hypothetical protein
MVDFRRALATSFGLKYGGKSLAIIALTPPNPLHKSVQPSSKYIEAEHGNTVTNTDNRVP